MSDLDAVSWGDWGAVAWMWITKRQKHLKKLYFHYILIFFLLTTGRARP